ncbi:hypothetical protein A2154_00220 [Candidatus Gottesmanbacteria bacterium RBG_16_43_7]|uniref:Hydrolase TatD n=1 Tax=Candidatus Gottesmanbacteria bacterium RBG_16_43_7 TaxID=1798373 RepID=A0A1F5ZA59_9BACT|nr:MAG: hypothetical protein A2154_00220 [Candidatus Gottesmanbacteria bacterium RBG_16_43_7]
MNKLFDTHCHLNLPQFNHDRRNVITNAKKAGVKAFIVPGVDVPTSQTAIDLARLYPLSIYASVGLHPYEAQSAADVTDLERLIEPSSGDTSELYRIIAVGECGLDYHIYKGEAALGKKYHQQKLLESQLQLAIKYSLPVIIHCREAFDDLFAVLDSLPHLPSGVLHCFSGGLQDIRSAQKRGLFVGFDGNITYSTHLKRIITQVPLDMILLETDSPNLTPVPHRGKRNEPKFLQLIAKALAELLNVSLQKVCVITSANANRLFSIS